MHVMGNECKSKGETKHCTTDSTIRRVLCNIQIMTKAMNKFTADEASFHLAAKGGHMASHKFSYLAWPDPTPGSAM